MSYLLSELAEKIGGTVRGDGDLQINAILGLEDAGPSDIAFLTHPAYRKQAAHSAAGALVVAKDDEALPQSLLICDNPALAVGRIVSLFHPIKRPEPSVHPTATFGEEASVDATATIGPYVTIGQGSTIAARAVIHSHVAIGANCHVGEDAVLHPHVVLYDDTEIGARTIVHSGSILGADGFRYVFHEGVHEKVPQVGRVVIGDDVEIGAVSAVDRASLEVTRVGAGTKIDNHVQIGHNAQVGKACILCGGVALAGSAKLGNYVVMGGHSGVNNHIEVGDGVQIAGQSAVFKAVEAGRAVAGTPAQDAAKWRREKALLGRLGDLRRRLLALEKRVEASSL